jgi:hypothetical protein
MDEFKYRRNIPNEQESWVHTPLIPRSLKLQRYTHEFRCHCECPPQQVYDFLRGKFIAKQWIVQKHKYFLIRDGNINSIQKLLPPSHDFPPDHRDGDFD